MIDLNREPVVRRFALNKIHPDTNARQEFDQDKLKELADSLLDTKGVLQPLLGTLRADGEVDLIAGERRWRASGLAGFEEVEVKLVEKPSRKDHLKWNLVENLQREDLTPIETAMRVQEMLTLTDEGSGLPQYNRASLATELGISAESVGRYEQLLRAPEKVKKAVNDDGLDMFIAALIGSLAESMRDQAARDMVFRVHGGPMNRGEAQRYVAENCRRDLRKGQFSREDATLVPDAGACSGCPFFGLNSETVAGKARGYTCLNPNCFDRKQQAHVNKVASTAENEGTKVLPQTMTSRVFQSWNNEVSHSCGYVDVKSVPDGYLLKEQKGKIPHWEKILEGTGVEVVVGFDHEGRVRRLVETKVAIEAAKRSDQAGLFKPKAGEDVESADDKKAAMQITKAKNKASKAALLEGLCAMYEKFSGQPWSRDVRLTLLADLCNNQTRDDLELLCRILQPDLKGISNAHAKLKELIDLHLDTDVKIDGFMLIVRKIRSIHFRGFDFKSTGYESSPDMLLYCKWAGFDAAGWAAKMGQRIKDAAVEAKAAIRAKNKPAKKAKAKGASQKEERACRVCGCTSDDCSGCIEKTGGPCYWVEDDLCSACSGEVDYHCDKCGLVCPVSAKDVPKVEAMKPGEFACIACGGSEFPWDTLMQERYVTWSPVPAGTVITDAQRAFYQGNPKCRVTDLQKKFHLDYTAGLALFDALVDEKYAAKAASVDGTSGNREDYARAAEKRGISVGTLAPGIFGKGPAKAAAEKVSKNQHDGESVEDFKAREAKRVANYKASQKAKKANAKK